MKLHVVVIAFARIQLTIATYPCLYPFGAKWSNDSVTELKLLLVMITFGGFSSRAEKMSNTIDGINEIKTVRYVHNICA